MATRLLFVISCLLIGLGQLAHAGAIAKAETAFSQGNKAYISGDYASAIELYEEVIAEHGYSADLLYNAGNAYYKKGDIGRAILCLERAHWLEPGNADIEKNLAAVRNNGGLIMADAPLITRYATELSLNQWLTVFSIVLFLFAVTVWIRVFSGHFFSGHSFRNLIVAASVVLAGTGVGIVVQWMELDRAIVIEAETAVKISPFDDAEQVASLKPGRVVYVNKMHGEYYAVAEKSGMTGWIKNSQIEKIVNE